MILSLIWAQSRNGVIGRDNQLPWENLPGDLPRFKKITANKPIMMGRKTFESIGRPLPGRKNIVLSRGHLDAEGITHVTSFEMALEMAYDECIRRGVDECVVIGGSYLYEEALPFADILYVTHVDADFEGDTYFPEIDWRDFEVIVDESYPTTPSESIPYSFRKYKRIQS